MPATFLHIQGRDDSAARVLELPIGPVRIGRGSHCEVRLNDPNLGEVQCMLRRRGNAWHFQPVGPPGHVWIEGRPADHQRPLAIGTPFRVGDNWLTLRAAELSTDVWGSFTAPIAVDPVAPPRRTDPVPPVAPTASETEPPRAQPSDAEPEHHKRWQARLDQRERWHKDRAEEKRWEARWKAAGESIRAQAAQAPQAAPAPAPSQPASIPRVDDPRTVEPLRRPAPPSRNTEPLRVAIPPRPARSLPTRPPERALPPVETPPPVEAPAPEPEVPTTRRIVALQQPVEPVAEPVAEPVPAPFAPAAIPAEWAEPVPFVSETLEGASMVWVEPAGWAHPPVIEPTPPRPSPAPARPEPQRPAPLEPTPPPIDPEWPSARAIFAAQANRAVASSPKAAPKRSREPEPTDPLSPAQWSWPYWLGALPVLAATILLGAVGLALSVQWAGDGKSADLAIRAASRGEKDASPLLDPAAIPRGGWWASTAGHASAWAVALERLNDGENRNDQIVGLIEAARHASPLMAQARFAFGPAEREEGPAALQPSDLGRPRDVVLQAWTARRLRRVGKVDASLRVYRSALELAARAGPRSLDPPPFDDDVQIRRYRLPHEPLVAWVVLDMVAAGEWTHEQWVEALPAVATARLAAARALANDQRTESDRLLDLVLLQANDPLAPGYPEAEHRAAVGEALALRHRWTDAAEAYRAAILLADDDLTRRMWWINLAEIHARVGDDRARSQALEAARTLDSRDEVSRRAIDYTQNSPTLGGSSRP